MKECTKCGVGKEEEEFYWRVKNVSRFKICKKCQLAQNKEYAQTEAGKAVQKKAKAKHRKTDKFKATTAAYEKSKKGKAVRKKAQEKHEKTYKRRIDKAAYRKTDKCKESKRTYAKTDKGKESQARRDARRYAKELAELNDLTDEQWEQIKGDQDHKCNGCGIPFSEEKPATEDHIIPIGVGPGRTLGNIQALCGLCNSIKGPRSMKYLLEEITKRTNNNEQEPTNHHPKERCFEFHMVSVTSGAEGLLVKSLPTT